MKIKRMLSIAIVMLGILASCAGESVKPERVTVEVLPKEIVVGKEENVTNNTVAPKTNTLSEFEVEEIFSQSVNFWYEGYMEDAIRGLSYLVSEGVEHPEVFITLLDYYFNFLAVYKPTGANQNLREVSEKALGVSRLAAQLYPQNLTILYKSCEILRVLGFYEVFYQKLQNILALDPNDLYANYYTAAYHFLKKDEVKAKIHFQNVIANNLVGKEFDVMAIYRSYYYMGIILAGELNYHQSAIYLEKAKSIFGGDYELIKYLAYMYLETMQYGKAVENFAEIPEAYQNDDVITGYAGALFMNDDKNLDAFLDKFASESRFIQAIQYYRLGDYENSLDKIERHIRFKRATDYISHYLLYLNYRALGNERKAVQEAFILGKNAKDIGQYDLSIKYFLEVEVNTNTHPEIFWLIGTLYDDKGDYTNATLYYYKYLSAPNNEQYRVSAYVRNSFLLHRLGLHSESEDSIALAKKTAKTKLDLYQAFYYSGLIHLEKKNYDTAIEDFQKALQSNKEDVQLYYFIANTYAEMKNNKKAINYLQLALQIKDDVPEVNNLLAYLYALEATSLDDALKLVNLALLKEPENIAYMDTLGWIYFQQSKYEKALEVFTKILFMTADKGPFPGLEEIYYHIGMVYEKLQKDNEAQKYYRMGFELNPQSDFFKNKLK